MCEEKKYDIVIDVENVYESFNEFYNDNKYNIYRNLVNLYHKMELSDKETFSLCINWTIKDIKINTEYQYDKFSIDILNTVLLPYFIEIEEYEICEEIKILYNKLNNGRK